jgi:hypothetical protein
LLSSFQKVGIYLAVINTQVVNKGFRVLFHFLSEITAVIVDGWGER